MRSEDRGGLQKKEYSTSFTKNQTYRLNETFSAVLRDLEVRNTNGRPRDTVSDGSRSCLGKKKRKTLVSISKGLDETSPTYLPLYLLKVWTESFWRKLYKVKKRNKGIPTSLS